MSLLPMIDKEHFMQLGILRPNPKKNMVCMGPYAVVDYNLTLCRCQSQLQHVYPGPYARVDLNTMSESTLSPSQGFMIW
jgi:hypothetical protein